MHHRCAEWANTICTYWSFSLLQLMSEKPLLNRFYGDFDVIEFYEFSLYFTLYRCMAIIQQHLPASRRVFRDIIHHVPNFIHCHLNRMNEANKLNGWVKEAVLTMNGKIPIVRNLIFGLVEVDCLTNWAQWTEKTNWSWRIFSRFTFFLSSPPWTPIKCCLYATMRFHVCGNQNVVAKCYLLIR